MSERNWADYEIPCPCCDPPSLRFSPSRKRSEAPNIKRPFVQVRTRFGDRSRAGLIGERGTCARCCRIFRVDCLDGNREAVLVEVDA